jgi:DNA-binding CsgD family transcriptional regulator
MSNAGFIDIFVMLCDWRGRCIFASAADLPAKVGEFVWEHLAADSQEETRVLLGRVVTLRESQQFEVVDKQGARSRRWLWPLDSPDVAVCMLSVRVPGNLALLTSKERECLELMAQGVETRVIAEGVNISISTVHTHMKRARKKLGLTSIAALISFAARYSFPASHALGETPSHNYKLVDEAFRKPLGREPPPPGWPISPPPRKLLLLRARRRVATIGGPMHLTSEPQQPPAAAVIPLSDLRELIHTLRNCAQRKSIHAENCQPGAAREQHTWRAEAFVEAAMIAERGLGLRDGK